MMLYQRFGRPKRKPVYRPYAFSFLSGVVLVLCFPTAGLWGLAWVALVPFLASLREVGPGGGFKAGFMMGLPYFFGTQYWIYHSISHYGGASFAVAISAVLLLAAYESLYTGVFGMLFSYSIRNTPLPALFLAPVYWVVAEFVRSYALTGFPWSSIGYTQHGFLTAIQFADITGVYGVSFLVVAVNGAVADLFITHQRRSEKPLVNLWPTAVGLAALAVFALAVLGYGQFRLNQHRPGREVKISVVQGSVDQSVKWDPAYRDEVLGIYEGLTAGVAAEGPGLVVWPETAAPFYWERDPEETSELRRFASALRTELLFGAVTAKDAYELSNSAVLIGKSGETLYIYDKIHLVPFGEYVPLRSVLGLFVNRLVEGVGDYVPGRSYEKAEAEVGSFGTLVCYEVIFPGLVRKFYKRGGDLMVNITNDAWFGRTTGPYQHFSMGVLRAVENRKPLVRAANTGISGFIDSSGRILKALPLFERGAITEEIRTDSTRTFYSRFGDLFSYLCIITTVILLASIRRQ
ncbi:MAG: apolipoprotein N-acyltransferase [Nitrospirota bacterium]|jgi:apolipoprotein N-acyltransferase